MLNGFPQLQEINCQIRDFLGMEVPDRTFLSDDVFKEPGKIFDEEKEKERAIAECGRQPENPWSADNPISEDKVQQYQEQVRIWHECLNRIKLREKTPGVISGRRPSSKTKLETYEE